MYAERLKQRNKEEPGICSSERRLLKPTYHLQNIFKASLRSNKREINCIKHVFTFPKIFCTSYVVKFIPLDENWCKFNCKYYGIFVILGNFILNKNKLLSINSSYTYIHTHIFKVHIKIKTH